MRSGPAGPPVVEQVDRGTFLVTGTDVNWVLLREGDALTLVDGGYPADVPAVEHSVATLGLHPRDVVAILVTHAHVDHLGAVNPFHDRYGTPVHLHPVEVAHARREHLEQLAPARVLAALWRPGSCPGRSASPGPGRAGTSPPRTRDRSRRGRLSTCPVRRCRCRPAATRPATPPSTSRPRAP
ncbi:MBL fold metallo-hydrolase [Pseudonocardia sp. ICBG1034]|uniref:MBL fold metallo-hydrolase n=1 Tax=Pseudonocardia sp. ICBG1034 TaxID=2844381 RepID=UPI001CC94888|nr:MBL fold metallo-hydrolase [Pseudonocardia sp. ICBG1034]